MLAEALKSAVLAGDVAGVLDLLNAGAPLVIGKRKVAILATSNIISFPDKSCGQIRR